MTYLFKLVCYLFSSNALPWAVLLAGCKLLMDQVARVLKEAIEDGKSKADLEAKGCKRDTKNEL